MKPRIHKTVWWVLSGMILILTGCAALTIDVDVYKGPLANHVDVQTEQTAAMAMGAKLLLVQLRNRLEKSSIKTFNTDKTWIDHTSNFINKYVFNEKDKEYFDAHKDCFTKVDASKTYRERLLKNQKFVIPISRKDKNRHHYKEPAYLFCDQNARSVNEILHLYDDLPQSRLSEIQAQRNRALRDYKSAMAIFRPDKNHRVKLKNEWKKIEEGLLPKITELVKFFKENNRLPNSNKLLNYFPFGKFDKLDSNGKKELLKNLVGLVVTLEHVYTRDSKNELAHKGFHFLLHETQKLFKENNILNPKLVGDSNNENLLSKWNLQNEPKIIPTSNQIFFALSHISLLKAATELLFEPESDSVRMVENHIITVSEAYQDSNRASDRLLTSSLEFILLANGTERNILIDFPKLNKKMAQFTMELVRGPYLLGMINFSKNDKSKECGPPLEGLSSFNNFWGLCKNPDSYPFKNTKFPVDLRGLDKPLEQPRGLEKPDVSISNVMNFMTAVLEKTPGPAAAALLDAHLFYKNSTKLDDKEIWDKTVKLPAGRQSEYDRKWGLTKGPGYKNFDTSLKNISNTAASLEIGLFKPNKTGAPKSIDLKENTIEKIIEGETPDINEKTFVEIPISLAKGRHYLGLETLNKKFRNTSYNRLRVECNEPKCGEVTVADERDRLFKALVHFAQKVLIIANYQTLFGENEENKFEYAVYRDEPEIQKYVRLLQAVGNSILFQVDELTHGRSYDEKLIKDQNREAHALGLSLPEYPEKAMAKLIRSLNSNVNRLEAELKNEKPFKALKEKVDQAKVKIEEKKLAKAKAVKKHREAEAHKNYYKLAYSVISNPKHPAISTILKKAPAVKIALTILVQNFVDALTKEINSKRATTGSSSVNVQQMEAAQKFLKELPESKISVKNDISVKVYESIKDFLESQYSQAILSAENNHKAVTASDAELVSAEADLLKAEQTLTQKKSARDTVVKAKLLKSQNAVKALTDNDGEIKKEIQLKVWGSGVKFDPEKFRAETINILEEHISKANAKNSTNPNRTQPKKLNDAIKLQKLKDAKTVIEARLPQMEFPLTSFPGGKQPNSKEVMDQLIAALKYEHIAAVRENGADSGAATQIGTALKLALERRADMVHIRPAVAYLRTSFPSTSLQRDASTTWSNMLLEDTINNSPIINGLGILNPLNWGGNKDAIRQRRNANINREIDKQFWQNINHIKLSGGGFTNYALMKDDVGNWVIKNYSSDPADVFKAAKNLALFNMGPGLGAGADLVNVPKQAPTTGKTDPAAPTTSPKTQDQQTVLEKQFEKFKTRYDEQTEKDLKGIKDAAGSLIADLSSQLVKHEDTKSDDDQAKLNKALEEAKGPLEEAGREKPEKTDSGDEVIFVLRKLLHFQDTASREIKKAVADPKLGEELKKAEQSENATTDTGKEKIRKAKLAIEEAKKTHQRALLIINEKVKGIINPAIANRLSVTDRYDAAVMITSETINTP